MDVDTWLGAPLVGLSDEQVLDRARVTERLRRQLAAEDHRTITELEVRSVASRLLLKGTAGLLSEVLKIDVFEARARVKAAVELGPRTSITGEVLAPLLPETAAAQARGDISAAHAASVCKTMKQLPAALGPEVLAQAEADLASQASGLRPCELSAYGEALQVYLDPDGTLTDDVDRARRRGFTVGKQGADGMTPVHGVLDPTCAGFVAAAFAALAKPTPAGDIPDERTCPQRQHDALSAVCRTALASRGIGRSRGLPATLVVTMGIDDLERRAGTATTATGGTMPVGDAVKLVGDANHLLGVFQADGQNLYLSRTARLATPEQRLALTTRDRGCTRPGCDVPPAWCEVHHEPEWQADGQTDIDKLCFVCPFDHHKITDQGYHVTIDGDRVWWTAPRHLDPDQTPRLNLLRHPEFSPEAYLARAGAPPGEP